MASTNGSRLRVPILSTTESKSPGRLDDKRIGPPLGIVLCSARNRLGPKSSLSEND